MSFREILNAVKKDGMVGMKSIGTPVYNKSGELIGIVGVREHLLFSTLQLSLLYEAGLK